MGESEAGKRRPSLVARALDPDERTQLQVLKAATEASAPLYGAILAVLVAAKERYQIQVRTEEIAGELAANGLDTATLTTALEQLKDWGAVTWTQDTSRVARLEDFHRRRELWQLTAAGHVAHDGVLRVLGAAEQAGSLQRALFRDIRENLDELATAVDGGDATATYLRLRDLDGALRDLAANARDFHATMAELRRDHELAPERFLAYKHLLIDYLQQFLDDLFRYRNQIAGQVGAVEERGVDRLVELAAAGDDSAWLFADNDLGESWRDRWAGLAAWFRPDRASPRTGAEELATATTTAIRDLMAFVRKLTESATRPITRASELLHLARWFARSEPAEAHRLFDAGFGLAPPHHLGQEEDDPDRTPAATSWWDAPAVDVPVTLREYGRRVRRHRRRPPSTTERPRRGWPPSTADGGPPASRRPPCSPPVRWRAGRSLPASSRCCSSYSTGPCTSVRSTPSSRWRSRPRACGSSWPRPTGPLPSPRPRERSPCRAWSWRCTGRDPGPHRRPARSRPRAR